MRFLLVLPLLIFSNSAHSTTASTELDLLRAANGLDEVSQSTGLLIAPGGATECDQSNTAFSSNLFCTNPVAAICQPGDPTGAQVNASRDRVVASTQDDERHELVQSEALAMTRAARDATVVGKQQDAPPPDRFAFRELIKHLKRTESAVGESVKNRGLDVIGALKDVKKALLASIDQELAAEPNRARKAKLQQMADKVASVNVALASDLFIPSRDPVETAGIAQDIRRDCSEDYLAANAFYDPKKNIFVLCPGMVLDTSSRASSQRGFTIALAMVIGHELGHAIDSESFPEIYSEMKECIQQRWNSGQTIAPLQVREITADFWGNSTVAQLSRHGEAARPGDLLQNLQTALQPLCGRPGDRAHPRSEFRIGVSTGGFEPFRKTMSCKPSDPGPRACALRAAR